MEPKEAGKTLRTKIQSTHLKTDAEDERLNTHHFKEVTFQEGKRKKERQKKVTLIVMMQELIQKIAKTNQLPPQAATCINRIMDVYRHSH